MIVIKTTDGRDVDGDENAVTLIAGPYQHDAGPHTYVYGLTQPVLVTAEKPDALVARLGVKPPLAKLTRPDLSPVWVKGSAVISVRAPVSSEQQGPGEVNTVLQVGSHLQSVREDLPTACGIIKAHGGNV
jgi:hypothetical protein